MELNAIKLVTIIGPKTIKDDIIALFKAAGISGYTYGYVFGGGESRLKGTEAGEKENVQFAVLVHHLLAITLMDVIAQEYFDKEKVIVFEQNANVIRYKKFEKVEYEA